MLVGCSNRPFWAGNGGTRPGPPGEAFERRDQRRFFSAHEGAGAFDQLDVEAEAAAHDVVAQHARLPGLLDGPGEAVHGQRVLGANVDNALRGAHHVGADDHAFEQRMRVALDFVAVHVGARVAFIRVTDDVLLLGGGLSQEVPLEAREIARAAAAAQLGSLDLLDHQLRIGVDQHLVERLVAADGDVFFQVVGADQAAIAKDDLLLRLEERNLLPGRDVRESRSVGDVGGQVVPLFDLAQREFFGDLAGSQVVEDGKHVAGLNAPQDDQRLSGNPHVDQRFLRAESEAADGRQLDVAALLVDGLGERLVDAFGSVAGAAGAHADADARPRR